MTIFFSSDTRGMLRRCGCAEGQLGGLSARASYIKDNWVEGRTLVLDAGDTLFDGLSVQRGWREFNALKARTLLSAMSESGYDAVAVGEYDLAYGLGFLEDAGKKAGLPLLSANLMVGGTGKSCRMFQGSVLRRFPGFTVGVVGVLDSEFPYEGFRESFKGASVSGPVEAAREEVGRLGGRADIVIVLAHLSVADAEVFARSLPEADIIIQGHSQETLEAPLRVGDTFLVKGFNKGKHIGRLDATIVRDAKAGGRLKVGDVKYSVIPLDESVPPDPEVEKIISGYRQELKKRAFVFESPDPEGAGSYSGPGECKGCHARAFADWSGTAHARAYESLVKTDDQYDPECLPCHTTGYGYASGYRVDADIKGLRDVTCEACHGRGAGHVGARKGGAGVKESAGVVREVAEKTCVACHDEYNSPRFQYEEYKALGGAHRGAGE